MVWKQLEPTAPHLTYLVLSFFLISYALFSNFIRNRLHLSEPPLATLMGIAFGPRGVGILDPRGWGLGDDIVMEFVCLISFLFPLAHTDSILFYYEDFWLIPKAEDGVQEE
jgi:sodium/hydrogen antiporter